MELVVVIKSFTVLLDLDSTVYNLWGPTLAYLNKKYNTYLTTNSIKVWCDPTPGYDPHEFWNIEGTFYNLKPYSGAQEAIQQVQNMGIRQAFLSTLVSGAKTVAYDKRRAVERDFPNIGTNQLLLTGGAKDLVRGDILVDDGAHNLAEFRAIGGLVVLCNMHNAPYCTYPADNILRDWKEYPSIIEDLYYRNKGWTENVG